MLSALVKRAEDLATETQSHRDSIISPRLADSHRPDDLSGAVSLSPDELISAYGIEPAPMKLARDEGKAIIIADELGYPIVIKITSPDILHKSAVGGVIPNLGDSSSLRSAYTLIMNGSKGKGLRRGETESTFSDKSRVDRKSLWVWYAIRSLDR